MEKEEKKVLTFKDKVGAVMATLGVGTILLSIFLLILWFFVPAESRSQINIIKPLVVLVFVGIGLIKLSFLW